MMGAKCERILNRAIWEKLFYLYKKAINVIVIGIIIFYVFCYTAFAEENISENSIDGITENMIENTGSNTENGIGDEPELMTEVDLSLMDMEVYWENGVKILFKEAQTLYAKEDVIFGIKKEEADAKDLEVAMSYDEGKSFGKYEQVEGDSYRLEIDQIQDNPCALMLKFRTKVITDRVLIKESRIYTVAFDKEPPKIEFSSDKNMTEWVNSNIACKVDILDEQSGIGEIIISNNNGIIYDSSAEAGKNEKNGDEQIYEVRSKARNQVMEIMLTDEAFDDSGNRLKISVKDVVGNSAEYETDYFLDKTAPALTFESEGGQRVYSSPPELNISVEDNSDATPIFCYSATRKKGGAENLVESFEREFDDGLSLNGDYSSVGDYLLEAYVKDRAGNISEKKTISYRLDSFAPEVYINGVTDESVYPGGRNIELQVIEDFYEDANAGYEVALKTTGDRSIIDSGSIELKGEESTKEISLSQDGEYYIKLYANDMAGGSSNREISFFIDSKAPEISFIGAKDNQITNKAPEVNIHVRDDRYQGTKVIASLMQKDNTGQYTGISRPEFAMTGEENDFYVPIEKEGIYKLRVVALDNAGNSSREEINLTLDYTPPSITGLDKYQRAYVQKFKLQDDVMSTVDDLTDVKLKAYLNSKEYDPRDEILQEGKYVLKFELTDEAGNMADEAVTFIVDSTKPELVIEGLKQDGTADKNGKIELSLSEMEDYFTLVKLNGEEINKSNNKVSFSLPEYGEYELYVEAEDEAGNILKETVMMKCALSQAKEEEAKVVRGKKKSLISNTENEKNDIKVISTEKVTKEKNNFVIIAIILFIVLLFLSTLGIILYRRKKRQNTSLHN